MTIFTRSFQLDLLLNYLSFVITAVGGLVFLFLLAHYLGMEGLGVVSLVLALYVVIAQLAVGGIHYSALHVASQAFADPAEKTAQIWSAVITAGIWGGLIALLSWASSGFLGSAFNSPRVGEGWAIVATVLVIFALNKTLASTLNGLNRMRRFAAQMALRAILLAGSAWIIAASTGDPVLVCWAIVAAELGVFLYLTSQVAQVIGTPQRTVWSTQRVKQHILFGLRGCWSGLSFEINTRLDVIVVGLFLSDAAVGLYALVAQIAEGFLNILIVVRNQLAPVLGKLAKPIQVESIQKLARTLLLTVVPLAAICAAIGVWLYAPAMSFLFPSQGYEAGTPLLAILLLGLVVNSWLLLLDTLLIVGGYPGAYSLLMVLAMATNMAANFTLVPLLGLHGAAIATAIASVSMGIYFLGISRQRFGFWLTSGSS